MEAIVADVSRTLKGWIADIKHVHPSALGEIDERLRMRLRSIQRKRRGVGDVVVGGTTIAGRTASLSGLDSFAC